MSTRTISRDPRLETVRQLLESAQLPTVDLTHEHCRHFFFSGEADRPDGLVGLEILGDSGLLRSLVVRESGRGAGLGSALVEHVEQYARERKILSVYLLTTTAEDFFAARGYRIASREEAPPAIRATREFSGLCPASSTFMVKQL